MNRVQLSQLAVLAAVAEGRSFRKAAAELAIAPSAVSHAVSSLEVSLGLRLLHRTTRSVSPTEEGKRLLETLGPALADIDAVIETLAEQGGRPAGPCASPCRDLPRRTSSSPAGRVPAALSRYFTRNFNG